MKRAWDHLCSINLSLPGLAGGRNCSGHLIAAPFLTTNSTSGRKASSCNFQRCPVFTTVSRKIASDQSTSMVILMSIHRRISDRYFCNIDFTKESHHTFNLWLHSASCCWLDLFLLDLLKCHNRSLIVLYSQDVFTRSVDDIYERWRKVPDRKRRWWRGASK